MSGYARRAVTLEPGSLLSYDEAAWRDAIVFVEAGEIILECVSGHVQRFGDGDILWLEHLPLRSIRNPGPDRARLLAISRRAPVTGACRVRSSLSARSPDEGPGAPG
jgi:hypothetical protein